MASYRYAPVMVLQHYVQEWEDYGECGFGDVNGQPLRSGEYLSFDEDGEQPLIEDLRSWFDLWAVDVMQQLHSKSLQDRMFTTFLRWLVEHSEGVSCTEELIDVFDVEELRGWSIQPADLIDDP